jgi:hypothetical protein
MKDLRQVLESSLDLIKVLHRILLLRPLLLLILSEKDDQL